MQRFLAFDIEGQKSVEHLGGFISQNKYKSSTQRFRELDKEGAVDYQGGSNRLELKSNESHLGVELTKYSFNPKSTNSFLMIRSKC